METNFVSKLGVPDARMVRGRTERVRDPSTRETRNEALTEEIRTDFASIVIYKRNQVSRLNNISYRLAYTDIIQLCELDYGDWWLYHVSTNYTQNEFEIGMIIYLRIYRSNFEHHLQMNSLKYIEIVPDQIAQLTLSSQSHSRGISDKEP